MINFVTVFDNLDKTEQLHEISKLPNLFKEK